MYDKGLNELAEISRYAGENQAYVQGGGGNTSVKLDGEMMAIKASGCRLSDMTPSRGFVAVNYKAILKYHAETEKGQPGRDYNKEVMAAAIESIRTVNGEAAKRPSVEAGFHAVLGRCVLHTHAAYVNVCLCAEEGPARAAETLKKAGIGSIHIPYETPGYYLTEKIAEALRQRSDKPDAILMGNHGLVVQAETAQACKDLHEAANRALIRALDLPGFPVCTIQAVEGGYASTNEWLLEKSRDQALMETAFTAPLYPDQLVYLGGARENCKITIGDGAILYRAQEAEALAMEETLSGVAYVADCIRKLGWKLKTMDEQAVRYITGWDSESYRKKQMAGEEK